MNPSTLHPAHCPACGRFVGPLEDCPYCGASVRKRIPLRYLQVGSLLLAIAGIALLLYAASGMPTRTINLGDIIGTMNYAYVRVTGRVTRGPLYDAQTQQLAFYVADETGEIRAAAFGAASQQFIASHRLPEAGDSITLEGTLRVRDDFQSLNVSSPDRLTLTKPQAQARQISEIGIDDALQVVTVQGDIRNIRTPYDGLTLVTLGDATGELDLALSSDLQDLYGELVPVTLGDPVQVKATVTLYRDAPQLTLTHPNNLRKLKIEDSPMTEDAPAAAHPPVRVFPNSTGLPQTLTFTATVTARRVQTRTPFPSRTLRPSWTPTSPPVERMIGSLSFADKDVRVSVKGQITRASSFSQGMRYTLDDGTGKIILLIWSDVLEKIADKDALVEGAQVQVIGEIEIFNNALEVIPQRGGDVLLIAPSLIPTPAPRTIASLSTNDLDQTVIVGGSITAISDFSRGKYIMLKDNTGEMRVTVFSNVLATVQANLSIGASISVRARVNLYRGELELIAEEGGIH